MMNYQQLLASLTPDVYRQLKRAVETGKWASGASLTPEQRQLCLQAVIAFDVRHKPEQDRVGYVHRKRHTACDENRRDDGQSSTADGHERPMKWQ